MSGKAARKANKIQKNIMRGGEKRKRNAMTLLSFMKYWNKALSIMNGFVNDIFEHIAHCCLSHYNKRSTIKSREIQTAVRLLLPVELAKHAVSEGSKTVTKCISSK